MNFEKCAIMPGFCKSGHKLRQIMLCKPLFIVHGIVKVFLKVILQYKNEMPQLQKWVWCMRNEIVATNAKFQVSVQILLYNKK